MYSNETITKAFQKHFLWCLGEGLSQVYPFYTVVIWAMVLIASSTGIEWDRKEEKK